MNHHITKRPDGKWQVKGEGNKRASVITDTQKEAIDLERKISRNHHGELFIHGVDGKIRARDSHGNDPFPPRG